MNTEQRIYNSLSKVKTSLKATPKNNSKKVNLGLVDDLSQDAEFFDEQMSTAIYYADEQFDALIEKVSSFRQEIANEVDNLMINTSVSQIMDLAEQKLPLLQKLESLANDLGVAPTELYADYEWLNGNVMNAKEVMSNFYKKYGELVETSGFLTDFS